MGRSKCFVCFNLHGEFSKVELAQEADDRYGTNRHCSSRLLWLPLSLHLAVDGDQNAVESRCWWLDFLDVLCWTSWKKFRGSNWEWWFECISSLSKHLLSNDEFLAIPDDQKSPKITHDFSTIWIHVIKTFWCITPFWLKLAQLRSLLAVTKLFPVATHFTDLTSATEAVEVTTTATTTPMTRDAWHFSQRGDVLPKGCRKYLHWGKIDKKHPMCFFGGWESNLGSLVLWFFQLHELSCFGITIWKDTISMWNWAVISHKDSSSN